MATLSNALRRMCVLAGVAVLSATASAFVFDARIIIDRALNSPTLTIKYSGATAALVELRVNGTSLGTRTLNSDRSTGETNFTLNLSALQEGDNEVEVRLFDTTGKLVGTEKSVIQVDDGTQRPIFLSVPKMGATVQGPVEIKLGFARDMRNAYASFFVNNQFKAMTNTPPFSLIWDTTREPNGWHEVEAWVIDESSNTLKTRKIRVFVNNPGGRTERRVEQGVELSTSQNAVRATDPQGEAGLRSLGGGQVTEVERTPAHSAPGVGGVVAHNAVKAEVAGDPSGFKPTKVASGIATGQKSLTPTGTRVAAPTPSERVATQPELVVAKADPPVAVATTKGQQAPTAATIQAATSAATTIPITKGQRLPNLATFAVTYNAQYVDFDVEPRVDNGVPMTPFRHLIEKSGGEVGWENETKTVNAWSEGNEILIRIGDRTARINKLPVELELAPYIDRGRTIVPLSFIRESLNVEIEYDRATGHVLITSKK
jgi:hypothetical protein